MLEYFQILGQEVYRILFLLVPILVSVAMIVWLDRRVWGLVQKRKGPNADWSIWPFVRQFRIACESQKRTNYFESSIKNWLDSFEKNREFKSLMYKYELWEPHSRKNYFPSN